MNYDWKIDSTKKDILTAYQEVNGYDDDYMRKFLDFSQLKLIHPNKLPMIDKAVGRIKRAIQNEEIVGISGDYDCDGTTGTSILLMCLSKALPNRVRWYIPERTEGYGMNKRIVNQAAENGVTLIITVDNGIACHEAIQYANSKGIEVIVTDHHQFLSNALPADIVVNPCIDADYKFPSVCGAYVAYKLMRMVFPNLTREPIHDQLAVLATIATIGDVMILQQENRKLVHNGLQLLNSNTANVGFGIRALVDALKLPKGHINATNIAFSVVPALNACSRMATPKLAVELLCCDDAVIAKQLAEKVVALNNKRKAIQTEVLQNIEINENDYVLFPNLEKVPAGILGIVAGEIAAKYQKPCFAMHEKENGIISGSGRSVGKFDISQCYQQNADYVSGGGHTSAMGCSLKKDDIARFEQSCNEIYKQWLEDNKGKVAVNPILRILKELKFEDINDNVMEMLSMLEPFGNGNREPIFATYNVALQDPKVMGKTNNTVKFNLSQNGCNLVGICFNGVKDKYFEMGCPATANIAYTLSYNYWRDNKTLQLMIVDFT